MPVQIVTVPCRSDNYAYLVRDEATGEVALVDAPEAAPIHAALSERGWNLSQIWITHHHADHVDGVAELREGATVIGNMVDRARLPDLDQEVSEGDSFTLGETPVRVLDVSGHTVGHIAFVIDEPPIAFTADSLMALGCGRVFEGTMPMMWESLSKLAALPDGTQVYSGHDYGRANGRFALSIEPENPELIARIQRIEKANAEGRPIVPATLAEEKATNPFLRTATDSVRNAVGMPEADPAEIFAELRRRKDRF